MAPPRPLTPDPGDDPMVSRPERARVMVPVRPRAGDLRGETVRATALPTTREEMQSLLDTYRSLTPSRQVRPNSSYSS